jgi:thioredoxin-related protein
MERLVLGLVTAIALAQASCAAERTTEASWLTDLSKAQQKAKQENKLVFVDFTGSDWCPPCKALHKNVLTSKEFIDFAKDNLVLVTVDFPNFKSLPPEQQKSNDALAEKFGIRVFPTVVVLDANGKKIEVEEGYEGATAKEFVASLKKLVKPAS